MTPLRRTSSVLRAEPTGRPVPGISTIRIEDGVLWVR